MMLYKQGQYISKCWGLIVVCPPHSKFLATCLPGILENLLESRIFFCSATAATKARGVSSSFGSIIFVRLVQLFSFNYVQLFSSWETKQRDAAVVGSFTPVSLLWIGTVNLLKLSALFQNAMPLDTHKAVKLSSVPGKYNSLSNFSQLALNSDLAAASQSLLMHSSAEDFIRAKSKHPAWKTLLSSVRGDASVDERKAPCWHFLFSQVAVKQRTLYNFYFLTAASVWPK